LTAQSADFCVTVTQSKGCGTDLALFTLQQGQIVMWDPECDKVQNTTTNVAADGSTATICVTGATIGHEYVISVKYDTKSIVGTHSGGGDCEYTFGATIGGVPVPGSSGSITATASADCNPEVSAGTCPNPVTVARATAEQIVSGKDLSVRAYPNPFKDVVNFQISSKVSGKVKLEVYNLQGQKVGVAFDGLMMAGETRTVQFKSRTGSAGLIYYLYSGNGKMVGKVFRLE